ncbi:hypothetical protein [Halalkalibacterium halodurans]|uniref:hypothetical protein n=1 Tax=Halalkalibacterium halodurans TaxID=86665 RepID=UPI002AA9A52D|nr:hypothetical protein [Halalkalibacterium halodurans]MDY7224200.1 hypothetical protein [Halalkalibacterium halodurans]MDY7243485.1 hypothetical protein [Halalkalibacterium halodurans]
MKKESKFFKISLLALSLSITSLLTACNESANPESIIRNANLQEEGPGGIDAEIIPFDLNDALEDADLIAEVTILEKVEEVKIEPVPYTVFRAEVTEAYMTETNSKEITIKQQGDSEWIFNDTKLFEVGETYFLFLKETSQSKAAYWIIGEDTGTFVKLDDDIIAKLAAPSDDLIEVESDTNFDREELRSKIGPNKNIEEVQLLDEKAFYKKIKEEIVE